MYSWIVGRVLRALMARLLAGDVRTAARMFARDAHLVFPGDSSFGGDHGGRPAVEAWLRRFVSLGPSFTIHDVAATGPPWNMRVFFHFSDRIPFPDGDGHYENEGMEYVRIRWGLIREQRVFLDTHRVAELDARLEAAEAVA
jgi:ketosteroid isomerase-like protein